MSLRAKNLKRKTLIVTHQASIFDVLKDHLEQYDLKSVADEAECHVSTLYNWLEGRTISPRLCTILKVIPVIGLELKLSKSTCKPMLRIVK